jgi:Putative Flp pilus-assembly TadE/G-like
MKRLGDESGQSLIVAALCMTCLMGFVALAADVGVLLHERRLVQIAADSGAIAGASELGFSDVVAAATADATANGFTGAANGASVSVSIGPLTGPHTGDRNYVEVIVSQSQPAIFLALFGRSAMTVIGRAVATKGAGSNCMYMLGPSGTDILMSGTGNLTVSACGILVDSNNNPRAIVNSGTGNITAKSIGVVAASPGYTDSGTGRVTTPVPDIAPFSDPLISIPQPAVPPSCTPFSKGGTGSVSLSPGCYSSLSITGTGTVTLGAGLYILNGPVNLTGTGPITGSNVTLYATSAAGAVTITGTQPMNLSAPTSGTYNGILFFQQRGDANAFTVTGTGNLNLTGIFYIPSASVLLTGTGNATYNAAFVAKQLQSTGTGSVSLTNYALTNNTTPLSSVRLVE